MPISLNNYNQHQSTTSYLRSNTIANTYLTSNNSQTTGINNSNNLTYLAQNLIINITALNNNLRNTIKVTTAGRTLTPITIMTASIDTMKATNVETLKNLITINNPATTINKSKLITKRSNTDLNNSTKNDNSSRTTINNHEPSRKR